MHVKKEWALVRTASLARAFSISTFLVTMIKKIKFAQTYGCPYSGNTHASKESGLLQNVRKSQTNPLRNREVNTKFFCFVFCCIRNKYRDLKAAVP